MKFCRFWPTWKIIFGCAWKNPLLPPPRKILPTPVQLHKASELNVRTYVLAAPQGLQSNKACYNEVKNRAE